MLTQREFLDAPELGIELTSALLKLYPRQDQIEKIIDILANESVYNAIVHGEDPHGNALDWQAELLKFEQIQKRFSIYE